MPVGCFVLLFLWVVASVEWHRSWGVNVACLLTTVWFLPEWSVEPQKRGSRVQFTPFAASSWTRRLQCHSGYTTWLIKGSCERAFCSQLQKVAVTSSLRSKCWSVPSIHDSLGWHMLPGSSRTLREGRRSCKQGKRSWTRGRRYAGHWSCIYSAVSISLQYKTITNPFLSSR